MLAHGITRSTQRWRQLGFVDALKRDNTLVLFDARGHGQSDKPHDPAAYGINMVRDVIAVLDDLKIDRTNYFGYSMGAGVGFRAAVSYPERFSSLILGGWSPYRTQSPGNAPSATNVPDQVSTLRNDPEAFLRLREQQLGRPLTPDERKAELANDPDALSALLAKFRDVATLNNTELACISLPCLLYAGDLDSMYAGAKEASGHMPHAEFFSLPGLDHVQAGASNLVLPHVREFLSRVNKTQYRK
jgi:pimeloyl-ACP methyl ester carboxylesterase